jgi:hypothetical protein
MGHVRVSVFSVRHHRPPALPGPTLAGLRRYMAPSLYVTRSCLAAELHVSGQYLHLISKGCKLWGAAGVLHVLEYTIRSPQPPSSPKLFIDLAVRRHQRPDR